MKKQENTFIGSVHKRLPPKSELYWMKNYNPFNGGIADCWYSANNDLWIEYKFIPKMPVRAIVTPDCSVLQLDWLRGRYEEGRNVWVIVGCPEGGVLYTDLTWENSMPAEEWVGRVQGRDKLANVIKAFCFSGRKP